MNRLLTILLLLAATAHGQIDNPPTTDSIGLGPTNDVTFNRVVTTANGSFTNPAIRIGASNTGLISVSGFLFGVSKGESVFGASPTGFTIVPPATFSTNVNVNATLAVSGNATLSGSDNLMPNATNAASASSLMTRELTDQRQTDRMIAGPRMAWLTTFTGWETAVSGGAVAQNVYLRPSTGTNQWNYAIARNFQTGELFTGSGDVFNFSKAGGYGAALYSPGANYRDGTSVIYLGAASSYVPSTGSAVSNPATKGFGWRIKDESIVATMFNTNYVEVATNSAVLSSGATTRENVWLYIDWNGSGGATWYVNGSSVASTTNGPTGATSVNNGYLIFGSVADIPLTTQNLTSITAFVLDREP